jgi:hypothetical protein
VEFVSFGDEESREPGHLHLDPAVVVGIEGADDHGGVVDQSGFEADGSGGGSPAVDSESCASGAGPGEGFGDQQVNGENLVPVGHNHGGGSDPWPVGAVHGETG